MNYNQDNEKAKEAALKLLRNRCTKKGLMEKLRRKGFAYSIAAQTAEEMERLGYIDDRDYAVAFLHDSQHISRFGRNKIRFQLSAKGIEKSVVEEAMLEWLEETELENIRYFIEKTLAGRDAIPFLEAEKLKRRLYNRGYRPGDIQRMLSEYEILQNEEWDGEG